MTPLIYVIDDDPEILKAMEFRLKKQNWNIKCFLSAKEAFNQISKLPPNAIILDFRIPEFDGLEFYQKLQSTGYADKIPVIIISGTVDLESKGFPQNPNLLLITKPCDYKELISSLKSMLAKLN